MKKNIYLSVTLIMAAIAVIFVFIAFNMVTPVEEKDNFANDKIDFLMNTQVTQSTYSKNDIDGKNAADKVTDALVNLENKTSMHLKGSDIYKLNKSVGKSMTGHYVKMNSLTYKLLKKSKKLSLSSDGMFDITIGALTSLWGVTSANPKVPSESEIQSMKVQVDANNLLLNDKEKSAALLGTFSKVDLGGVAKGYGCDLAMSIYKKSKVDGAVISIGGNVAVYGTKTNGGDFTIGIKNPLQQSENSYIGTINTTDCIISTSGGYERYFEVNNEKYHHIIDPRTGKPAKSDVISVTVITDSGLYGDYLSTTLYIGGLEKVKEYIAENKIGIICIDNEKNVWVSKKLIGKFSLSAIEENGSPVFKMMSLP